MQCYKMIFVVHSGVSHKVPCGKCAFCLTNRRSSWMFRIHHEMRKQLFPGYFLTLTYDEKHVKRVAGGRLSLRFRDVQLFIKRVRKARCYCKYVCVGEYGGITKRPHYHMLLWTDCKAEALQSFWHQGSIHFGTLCMKSAMYTLKYIIQPKQRADEGVEPTRAQFSRGIGIGYLGSNYVEGKEMYDYHNFAGSDPVMFSVIDGQKVALPRYYKNKIFTKDQCQREAWKFKLETEELQRKECERLLVLGIRDPKAYLYALRSDECKRIIATTKFNLTL